MINCLCRIITKEDSYERIKLSKKKLLIIQIYVYFHYVIHSDDFF